MEAALQKQHKRGAIKTRPKKGGGRTDNLGVMLSVISLLVSEEQGVDGVAAHLGIERRSAYRVLQNIERAGLEVLVRRDGPRAFHRIPASSVRRAMGL